jgi:hypothetical protein
MSLGCKRVDPFTTRLSLLKRIVPVRPVYLFFFFFFFFFFFLIFNFLYYYYLKKKKER